MISLSCRLLINNTKLNRTKKNITPVATRHEAGRNRTQPKVQQTKDLENSLCGTNTGELREAMIMKMNETKQMRKTLSNGNLPKVKNRKNVNKGQSIEAPPKGMLFFRQF